MTMSAPAVAPAPAWHRFYGDVPVTLAYPRCTVYQAIRTSVERHPGAVACEFLGSTITYEALGLLIDRTAGALAALGVRPGDRLLLILPTTPQGVAAYYACNSLGAVAAMVHPLAAPAEIERHARATGARVAVTLDTLYERLRPALDAGALETLVLTRVEDGITGPGPAALQPAGSGENSGQSRDHRVRWWADLLAQSPPAPPRPHRDPATLGTILFSGGTTGAPKGIMLSDCNLVSEGLQIASWIGMRKGDRVLAALPLFHGFGLSTLVNAPLMSGCRVILVPEFSPDAVARVIRRSRPNFIAGVPSFYDALTRHDELSGADLSCIRAAFSGGDTLPARVKLRFDRFLAEGGSKAKLLEGYGLTENVTAAIVMPLHVERSGSIGVPLPDTLVTIRDPESGWELPVGEEGEICVSGPAVMLGYLNDPETTKLALRRHGDDRVWLHTGDIGRRDEDGFFYFLDRRKRMIKSSGFNVFPAEVEQVLRAHPDVAEAHVLGVADPGRGQRVRAYVVPADPAFATADLVERLLQHCRTRLNTWSCPHEIAIRRELPMNRVGKVDEAALLASAAGGVAAG